MAVVDERCCGLDVHHTTVVAAAITPAGRQTRTFGTMTAELLALSDWLVEQGIPHVAMASTGVYWKPIHNLLEAGGFTILVVNAQHIKARRPPKRSIGAVRPLSGQEQSRQPGAHG